MLMDDASWEEQAAAEILLADDIDAAVAKLQRDCSTSAASLTSDRHKHGLPRNLASYVTGPTAASRDLHAPNPWRTTSAASNWTTPFHQDTRPPLAAASRTLVSPAAQDEEDEADGYGARYSARDSAAPLGGFRRRLAPPENDPFSPENDDDTLHYAAGMASLAAQRDRQLQLLAEEEARLAATTLRANKLRAELRDLEDVSTVDSDQDDDRDRKEAGGPRRALGSHSLNRDTLRPPSAADRRSSDRGLVRSPVPMLDLRRTSASAAPLPNNNSDGCHSPILLSSTVAGSKRPPAAATAGKRNEPPSHNSTTSDIDGGATAVLLEALKAVSPVRSRIAGAVNNRTQQSSQVPWRGAGVASRSNGRDGIVSPSRRPNRDPSPTTAAGGDAVDAGASPSQKALKELAQYRHHYRALAATAMSPDHIAALCTTVVSPYRDQALQRHDSVGMDDDSVIAFNNPRNGIYGEPFLLHAPYGYNQHTGQTARGEINMAAGGGISPTAASAPAPSAAKRQHYQRSHSAVHLEGGGGHHSPGTTPRLGGGGADDDRKHGAGQQQSHSRRTKSQASESHQDVKHAADSNHAGSKGRDASMCQATQTDDAPKVDEGRRPVEVAESKEHSAAIPGVVESPAPGDDSAADYFDPNLSADIGTAVSPNKTRRMTVAPVPEPQQAGGPQTAASNPAQLPPPSTFDKMVDGKDVRKSNDKPRHHHKHHHHKSGSRPTLNESDLQRAATPPVSAPVSSAAVTPRSSAAQPRDGSGATGRPPLSRDSSRAATPVPAAPAQLAAPITAARIAAHVAQRQPRRPDSSGSDDGSSSSGTYSYDYSGSSDDDSGSGSFSTSTTETETQRPSALARRAGTYSSQPQQQRPLQQRLASRSGGPLFRSSSAGSRPVPAARAPSPTAARSGSVMLAGQYRAQDGTLVRVVHPIEVTQGDEYTPPKTGGAALHRPLFAKPQPQQHRLPARSVSEYRPVAVQPVPATPYRSATVVVVRPNTPVAPAPRVVPPPQYQAVLRPGAATAQLDQSRSAGTPQALPRPSSMVVVPPVPLHRAASTAPAVAATAPSGMPSAGLQRSATAVTRGGTVVVKRPDGSVIVVNTPNRLAAAS